jgi:hypothetical protein
MLTPRGAIFLTHGFSRVAIPISFTLAYKFDQVKKIVTGSIATDHNPSTSLTTRIEKGFDHVLTK